MNLAAEKDAITNEALEKELDASLIEAENGEELSFDKVSAELRKKYGA